MPESYMLGEGVFAIGGVDIALTRGGGQYTVARTYKQILADGDMGPVKERIRKDGSTTSLVVRKLEMLPADMPKYYPAIETDTVTTPGTTIVTAKEDIEAADYQDEVTWTGKLASGEDVIITLENAINLNNIDLALIDKDEVVAELMYTATYLEAARKTEPWKMEFVTA